MKGNIASDRALQYASLHHRDKPALTLCKPIIARRAYRGTSPHRRLANYIQLQQRPPFDEPLKGQRREVHSGKASVENKLGHAPPDYRPLLHPMTGKSRS